MPWHKQWAPDALVTREIETLPRLHHLVFVGPCESIVGVSLAALSRARKNQRRNIYLFFLLWLQQLFKQKMYVEDNMLLELFI